jgi:ATP-dependent DNA ligase
MLSKNGHHLKRYDVLLSGLPTDCVFDGEIVVLGEAGRPQFNALLFRRGQPVYVAFDVLYAHDNDLRDMPLQTRKAAMKQLLRGCQDVIAVDGIAADGTALFREICRLDLEGIVAKRMADPHRPDTTWFKVLNRSYSQKEGRGDLFNRRSLPPPATCMAVIQLKSRRRPRRLRRRAHRRRVRHDRVAVAPS